MLPGVKIIELKRNIDERGSFVEILRNDWPDFLEGEIPVQINLSMSYPGMIRAWHYHLKGQVDYFIVVSGSMKICAYDNRQNSQTKGQLDEIYVSSDRLQIVRVPGYYLHGTKTVGVTPSLTVYAVSRPYNSKNPDEHRVLWNDPAIIDPKTNQPYDWNKSPHK